MAKIQHIVDLSKMAADIAAVKPTQTQIPQTWADTEKSLTNLLNDRTALFAALTTIAANGDTTSKATANAALTISNARWS